jgi:hypothetical protein
MDPKSSLIFSGKEICVVQKNNSPPVSVEKLALDNIILKHGGSITFNPGSYYMFS